jgi:hypothetical protein
LSDVEGDAGMDVVQERYRLGFAARRREKMAKKSGKFGFDTDNDGDDDVTIETTATIESMGEIPDGLDEAIYKQGFGAGLTVANGGPEVDIPFDPATPQGVSWQAGYDAGKVPPV